MLALMVVVFAWIIRLFAENKYPDGYRYPNRLVPPFWYFIGCSAIFCGVMFQVTWMHGLSPLLVILAPIGILITLVYFVLYRKPLVKTHRM